MGLMERKGRVKERVTGIRERKGEGERVSGKKMGERKRERKEKERKGRERGKIIKTAKCN